MRGAEIIDFSQRTSRAEIPNWGLAKLMNQTSGDSDGVAIAGDGWIYREELEKSLSLELAHCVNDNFTSMEDFCRLAAARFRKGDVVNEEQVLPNYVKEQMDYS